MDQKFILTTLGLQELQELGYTEVWIGNVQNPHWTAPPSNAVIASPKRKRGGWPAVWSADRYFGKISCGNGLARADQCQKSEVHKMTPGHYRLENETWFRVD
ncbi:hypothetical protein EBT16_00525 [bacterium]|nr:hypothetical protein [bacterium]